jgi:hypothetical protein
MNIIKFLTIVSNVTLLLENFLIQQQNNAENVQLELNLMLHLNLVSVNVMLQEQ